MAHQIAAFEQPVYRRSEWRSDAAAALLISLAVVVVHAAKGFPMLADSHGDNDNLMRMVQVLDLLSGQGWFDLHQYRMGPPGGFVMHWSRFVDAPIAAIILGIKGLTGSLAAGEAVASILWPALLFAAGVFLQMRLARRYGGAAAVFPAAVVGALGLYAVGIFAPGSLDHHNVQLVLTLAMIAFLLGAQSRPLAGTGAGIAASLMLVVGMETTPYVAMAGLLVAGEFLLEGRRKSRATIAFSLSFALASLLGFFATVPSSMLNTAACDAFSIPQMSVAVIAGAGLAAATFFPVFNASLARRAIALTLLAAASAVLVLAAFPQCLADPYAGLDPRLKTYWLSSITEAQSFASMLHAAPVLIATYYVTPVIGLGVLLATLGRYGARRPQIIIGAFLAVAIAVSLWQVRGSYFSIPLAVIPLASWVGKWRERAAGKSAPRATSLKMLAAWLLSFNIAWSASTNAVAGIWRGTEIAPQSISTDACYAAGDYATLAAMPEGTVLAVSNLGTAILRYTSHRVLAGPYHRNVKGNLAALDAFMGSQSEAEAVIRRQGVTIVALCSGNDETAELAAAAPDGLMADLAAGRIPAWLKPVHGTDGDALRLFRVAGR